VLAVPSGLASGEGGDAVGWFSPWVELDGGDRADLRRGEVLVESLSAGGDQLAVFLASTLDADPDRFVAAVADPARLWGGDEVRAIARFSEPPRPSDVSALSLSEVDLAAIRDCRAGDCDVKLTAAEMERLRAVADRSAGDWRSALQSAFRSLVLQRVEAYRGGGLAALDAFHDHEEALAPASAFAEVLAESPWLTRRAPDLARYFADYPASSAGSPRSFLYWLETMATPKPTVQVVHVAIQRQVSGPDGRRFVVVGSRLVFATHYLNASLALSVLPEDAGAVGHLAYLNRTQADGLGGWLSGLKRFFVERRVRSSAKAIFERQRRRIEGE
jgi:hypothetical protein